MLLFASAKITKHFAVLSLPFVSVVVIARKLRRIHKDQSNSHQLLQSQHVEHPGGLLNNVKLDYGSGV